MISIGAVLDDTGVEPYRTYSAEFPGPDKNTYRWGNVEGMAFTPDGSFLLCGMRNPLHGTEAILFVVDGVEEAFRSADPEPLRLTDIFPLQLGGRGVSDLCWDPLTVLLNGEMPIHLLDSEQASAPFVGNSLLSFFGDYCADERLDEVFPVGRGKKWNLPFTFESITC